MVSEPSSWPTNKVLIWLACMLTGQAAINVLNESELAVWIMDGLNILLAFVAAYATCDRDNTPGF
jgi:hypothetical protein